ncbi:uncharacterized protein LOC126969740 [Leptidea sinapis]|uniref:MADF domain-containing protein n=1 Tax=Leptidea sinapis TaxID=189913 RepID=A0A5E4PQL4_9NEOP|nr:uncharacterized protein LOC126969740 [Leptidea sinapis]VVC87342.1 unnamed protein product [Leptidea sinapis]
MNSFNESLIEAVRERPFLYDSRHSDYKNPHRKAAAWTEIMCEIGGDSDEAIKERWKNLRDTYVKHKKSVNNPNIKCANNLKNWIWASQMEFLDDYLNIRTAETDPLLQEVTRRKKRKIRENRHESTVKTIEFTSFKSPKKTSTEELDKIDYLFLNYADTFKRLPVRRQAVIKLELAKLFTEAELASLDDEEALSKSSISIVSFDNDTKNGG